MCSGSTASGVAAAAEGIAAILFHLSSPDPAMATLMLPLVLILVRNVIPFDQPDQPGCVPTTTLSALQLLSRDLRRVKEDAFALEQRLDQALDDERQPPKNSQEDRELEEGEQAQAPAKQAQLGGNAGREGRLSGKGGGIDEEKGEKKEAKQRWNDVSVRARHEGVGEAHDQVYEEDARRDGEGVTRLSERDARDGSFGEDGVRATVDEEVDFVGEDDEENVWQ